MTQDLFPGRAGYIQLVEWGYPQSVLRSAPTNGFSVVHITGNSRLPSAQGELAWRRDDPANQNSATFFVNRDGTAWQALGDPLRMAPWANGDVSRPDTTNPRIAAMVRDGVNANQRTIVAIENVGFEPGASITAAQEATNAEIIAYYHGKAGVPVTRQTVVGHYQLNSTSRPNCPAVNKSVLDRIVALATGEDDLILVPTELFPEGTLAGFGQGTVFSLYRVRNGAIERRTLTTEPDKGTAAATGGRVALNGDTAHAGVYISNGTLAGWVVSAYGPQPTINKPVPPIADCSAQDATIKTQAATIATLQTKLASAKTNARAIVAL